MRSQRTHALRGALLLMLKGFVLYTSFHPNPSYVEPALNVQPDAGVTLQITKNHAPGKQ